MSRSCGCPSTGSPLHAVAPPWGRPSMQLPLHTVAPPWGLPSVRSPLRSVAPPCSCPPLGPPTFCSWPQKAVPMTEQLCAPPLPTCSCWPRAHPTDSSGGLRAESGQLLLPPPPPTASWDVGGALKRFLPAHVAGGGGGAVNPCSKAAWLNLLGGPGGKQTPIVVGERCKVEPRELSTKGVGLPVVGCAQLCRGSRPGAEGSNAAVGVRAAQGVGWLRCLPFCWGGGGGGLSFSPAAPSLRVFVLRSCRRSSRGCSSRQPCPPPRLRPSPASANRRTS